MQSSLTKQGNVAELEGDDGKLEDLEENDVAENEESGSQVEGGEVREPFEGMEFDSEDDARRFYYDYARRVGFVVRLMQKRRSEIDGKTLARRLGCNKQGFSTSTKTRIGPDRKPRPSARGGCNATILVRLLEKSGKWVCTRFEKEHNHPLVVTDPTEYTNMGDKEKKIQELTRELQRQEELCAAYKQGLINLLAIIENQAEHLSTKAQTVVENLKNAELKH